jgi:uncharacterized protein YecE (DUF72 family)
MGLLAAPERFNPVIRVGPAGWSYRDWAGIVYPQRRPKGFHEAGYLANYFDVLEINASFYGQIRPATAAEWLQRTAHNPRFEFTAKLHQSFTHARTPADADERGFRAMADVLAAAGRLGAVLAQFPFSFRNTSENRIYLDALLERLAGYPMVVEMRHASWNDPHIHELLAERGAAFCNVDQPVIGESLPPSAVATAPVGYVRLHGRNYKEWFAGAGRDARYNYLYNPAELEAWKQRIKDVGRKTQRVYVIANNHFQGQAAANALELIALLLDKPAPAPPSLVAAYPRLAECTVTEQGRLPL